MENDNKGNNNNNNNNIDLQSTTQPRQMAGMVDGVVDECMCAHVSSCMCTGAKECLCGDAEEYDVTKKSGAVGEIPLPATETSTSTSTSTGTDNSDAPEGQHTHPCVGGYRLEPTSSAFNRCGMFALSISTASQLGIGMTEPEFARAYASREMKEFNRELGYEHVQQNFFDDQLACILRVWGRSRGLGNLQLGVIVESADMAYIIGEDKFAPVSSAADVEGDEGGFTTVWIHNDNATELWGSQMNHYSGITLLRRGGQPSDRSGEEERGTEKGSAPETPDRAKTVDDEQAGQEAEEVRSAKGSKRKCSWVLLQESESESEDSQDSEVEIWFFQSRCGTDSHGQLG